MSVFMERALELARRGAGAVDPNPLVGAVIVRDGRIIGEGWHEKFGGPHAEINAFSSLKESAEGADMYVTLEPCAHYGKTPPCAEAIVRHKLKRVYVGILDPNEKVAGKGAAILRNAGIEVNVGMMEQECRRINAVFFKHITTGLPYVWLKWAMSLDGKTACSTGESKWISCGESRGAVHALRNRLMGIMTGINTVLADDPQLTCRIEGGRDPYRIICDSKLKIPLDARVIGNDGKCIIATVSHDAEKIKQLTELGAEVIETPRSEEGIDLCFLMKQLGGRGINGILAEGGGTLVFSLIKHGLADHVTAYLAPMLIGGETAKTPVGGRGFLHIPNCTGLENMHFEHCGRDIVIDADIKKG